LSDELIDSVENLKDSFKKILEMNQKFQKGGIIPNGKQEAIFNVSREGKKLSFKKKVDSNQVKLVKHARKLGASVQHLHAVGGGVPDVIIGYQGKNYLCEVKTEQGKLNALQVKWHSDWTGHSCVIRTENDINNLLGVL